MLYSKLSCTKPLLSEALSITLPTEEQTWLLQACLWPGEVGRQAWTVWRDHIDDPTRFLKDDQDGVKGLLSLLFHALRDKDAIVDKTFQTYLRTAYIREELRSQSYRQIWQDVLATFAAAGIPAILLKGAALADTVYETPVLQHSHYLEILIKDEDLLRATSLLPSLGFESLQVEFGPAWQRMEIRHESRLPLLLYRRLFPIPFYDVAMADLWARSRVQHISHIPTRLLSPADNLLHICGSAFYAEQHESLRWVCDSWFLITRCPDLDWDILLDSARRHRLALPLAMTLGYLQEQLNAPIPVPILHRLYAAASRTDAIGREVVLSAARAHPRGGFRRLLQTAGTWQARALILQWMLFPSLLYLRWTQQIHHFWVLPLYYFYRPLRYLVRRKRGIAQRLWRRWRNLGPSRVLVNPL